MDLQKVSGKVLDTAPIKHLLRQGEANVDKVYIPIDKIYSGIDVSTFAFELRAESEKDTLATQVLEREMGKDVIRLIWRVSSSFTAVAGNLDIVIVGLDSSGAAIIKITGDSIVVKQTAGTKYLPAPNIITDALNQVTIMVNRAVSAALAAEKSAAISAATLQNAKAYTDQQVQKLLSDSIYKMPYYDPLDGAKKNLQTILDNLASQRFGAYTCAELDAKNLTCGEFDALGLTCEQFDDGGW